VRRDWFGRKEGRLTAGCAQGEKLVAEKRGKRGREKKVPPAHKRYLRLQLFSPPLKKPRRHKLSGREARIAEKSERKKESE
jgi:hypothetical protein